MHIFAHVYMIICVNMREYVQICADVPRFASMHNGEFWCMARGGGEYLLATV